MLRATFGNGDNTVGEFHEFFWRGKEYKLAILPKVKIEISKIVIHDSDVEKIMNTISESAANGNIGDGKIFVSLVDDAMCIRTRERGDIAI